MTPHRADLILKALGWSRAELVRQVNRYARTRYNAKGDAWRWWNSRGIPNTVALFLRMAVRIARLERRKAR